MQASLFRAFLIRARQELLAPLLAMREVAGSIASTAKSDAKWASRLARLNEACDSSIAMIEERFDGNRAISESEQEQFLGTLRHDLNNPLTALHGNAELLLAFDQQSAGGELVDQLELINNYCELYRRRVGRLRTSEAEKPSGLEVITDPAAVEGIVVGETAPAIDVVPGRVLLVDDNEQTRAAIAQLLEAGGHTVLQAASGDEALRIVNDAEMDTIDVVLLDVRLGEIDGCQVLQEIKRMTWMEHVPVVMISAVDDQNVVARCIGAGADDYLFKPVNFPLLQSRLKNCLTRVRQQREHEELIDEHNEQKKRLENILRDLFPDRVVHELIGQGDIPPRRYAELAVMFCDIVGFTSYCDANQDNPQEVVAKLRRLFEEFEKIADAHKVEKIKTIGDCFMGACWTDKVTNNVEICIRCGEQMLEEAAREGWKLRIGIHCGPVIAGKVGNRQYCFDLWGDAVNTAARVQTAAAEDSITLSREAWTKVQSVCYGHDLGTIEVRGKGPLRMYKFLRFVKKK
jgi:class 3 adenylate cyclase/CheY-like chemotaxis protein